MKPKFLSDVWAQKLLQILDGSHKEFAHVFVWLTKLVCFSVIVLFTWMAADMFAHRYEANLTIGMAILALVAMFIPVQSKSSAKQSAPPVIAPAIVDARSTEQLLAEADHTTLHEAVRRRDKIMLALLIARGANVDYPDADGKTPLDIAKTLGNEDLVRLLIAKGAKTSTDLRVLNLWFKLDYALRKR